MTEVTLELEIADAVDGAEFALKLEKTLAGLSMVSEAEAQVDGTRSIAEVMTIVAAGVVLLNQGTAAVGALKNFIEAVRELMKETDKLKQVFIEVRGKKVDIATVTDEEIEALDRA